MELNYTSSDGKYCVKFVEQDNQSMFERIASFQEIFESDTNVVINNKSVPRSDIKLRVRGSGENKFFEMYYCGPDKELSGYRLDFTCGQNRDVIFPRKKDRNGNIIENNGWYKYVHLRDEDSEPVEKKSTRQSKDIPY